MSVKHPDLSVSLAGIKMKNPVMAASGTFGYASEYADLVDIGALGAVVVKGISLAPAGGNPTPRMRETPSGLLNAIGLQNPGFEKFVADYLPQLRAFNTPIIVNIWGRTLEEYTAIAARFERVEGVRALELNISCPNIRAGGIAFGTDPDMTRAVIASVRRATSLPLIPKLPPNIPNVATFIRIAEDNGADAVSLVNSFPAMAIDVETRRPVLANTVGGLSGPAIHPIAVKLVWEACQAARRIPIIGIGGIAMANDALEFIIAGATAVAVGTATFTDPNTMKNVIAGIGTHLQSKGLASIRDLRGTLEIAPARTAS